MRLLLTSAGIKNTSIHAALVDLLGKPIAESSALCIPTASYGHPMAGPSAAWRFISGRQPIIPMCESVRGSATPTSAAAAKPLRWASVRECP
jgi:dipeptidase E